MIARLETCPSCGTVFASGPAPATPPIPPPPASPTPYGPSYPAPAPPPPATASKGLSTASVPKILLGLGATCLLVAAVIFLAVAWSWLGIGGRTVVLAAMTAATALAGQWLARRDLGVAAEALTVVSLGLVVLDLVGARNAGWLGAPTEEELLAVVGATLLVLSLALCAPATRLFAPQLAAPLGLAMGALGTGTAAGHPQVVAVTAVLSYAALALLGRRLNAALLTWLAVTGGLLAFTGQAMLALSEAADHPSVRGLWVDGHGIGLLGVAATVLLPWLLVRGHDDLRQLVCAASLSTLTFTAALPLLDEGLTPVTLAAAVSSALWAVAAAATPLRWYAVPRVPMVGSLLVLLPAPALLATEGVANLVTIAPVFTADVTVRLDPAPHSAHPVLLALGVAVAGLALALTVPRPRQLRYAGVGVAAATAVLTGAQYPLPLAVFVAVLGPLGVVVAGPSAVLTLLALGEVVLLAAIVLVRRPDAVAAAAVLPPAVAGFLFTGAHVLAVRYDVCSLVTLLVLGLVALAMPRLELEVASATTVLGAATAGVSAAPDASVSLAVHLTLAGALVTTTSLLHRDHRPLAWLGGLLLAAATWVRLYDVGVTAPEAYTLPTALALTLVGMHRLGRDAGADTVAALLPGLGLATVPSLLWVLADPLSPRAVLLGTACLGLLLAGSALRWTAPVLVGWLVGAALVLRELAPYAAHTPQWVVIGAAGGVLIGAGVTWETRVRDLRRTAAYLGRLR
jgi:hypothetical protein